MNKALKSEHYLLEMLKPLVKILSMGLLYNGMMNKEKLMIIPKETKLK
jgi:hypothetical protein